jgi:intracellular septation protein A
VASEATTVEAAAREPSRRPGSGAVTIAAEVILPIALYYALRAAGTSVYLALLVGAVVPAAVSVATLVRSRTVDQVGAFMLTTLLLGVAVSLIAGSPRFLLAKEAWVTAAVGAWFLISAGRRRPLAFVFARAMLEGRSRFSPEPWDALWDRSTSFRRTFRISSLIWGVGMLVDAAARIVMAYALPIDLVPALSAGLSALTVTVLVLIDQINYHRTGFRQVLLGRSPAYAR